jgi:hypothetical protein
MEPDIRSRTIIAGVHDLIDKALGVNHIGTTSPHSRHLESCQQLNGKQPANFKGVDLIRDIYTTIVDNWKGGKGSAKNFRWEPHPNLSVGKKGKGQRGAEVPFERALVILSELRHNYGLGSWTNQVPVASGLVDATSGKEGERAKA